MPDYLGGDYLYSVLNADSEIDALVGENIFNGLLVPQTVTSLETINFYRISPTRGGESFFDSTWSIDCRSSTEPGSQAIAEAVQTVLNREDIAVGDYTFFGVADIGQTIPPRDETDVYNTPVSIRIRRK